MLDTHTVSLRALSGAAGRTLIQGLHLFAGFRIIVQADDVTGQTAQNLVFRVLDGAGNLAFTSTAVGGGHGSTVGQENLEGGKSWRMWFGHEARNQSGYVTLTVGQASGNAVFTPVAGLPRGDISIDQGANLLCLRNGNRFRGYKLDTVKDGDRVKLWDFTIPGWGNRFQGHLVHDGRLFVHRDVATKAESRAHVFDYAGKPVLVAPETNPTRNYVVTTGMGDEAEGFVVMVDPESGDETVCVVKRTGGNNSSRVVTVTPWLVVHPKAGADMSSKVPYRGGYTCGCVVAVFPLIEAEMIAKGIIKRSIDVWQWGYRSDVPASANTHAAGGVIDTAQYSDAALAVWRSWGFEVQKRTTAQGFDMTHGHGVLKGCPHLSTGKGTTAAWQAAEWEAGRNGLVGRGKITGPGPIGKATPTWQQAIKNHAEKETLADVVKRLGPVSDVSAVAINAARGTGNPSRHVAVMQEWLNTVMVPKPLLVVDGIWSKAGPTQAMLDKLRKSWGWTDYQGEVGPHSLTLLQEMAAKALGVPVLPVREKFTLKG